jgi:hypothetical protein
MKQHEREYFVSRIRSGFYNIKYDNSLIRVLTPTIEIYQAANNDKLKKQIRLYLRAGEKQLSQMLSKKSRYFLNTCEGIATSERVHELIRRCSFNGLDLCNFDLFPLEDIASLFFDMILNQSQVRELARSDPWRSMWALNDSQSFKLFNNSDRELSLDQKNILVW